MSRRGWSDDDRVEFETLVSEALSERVVAARRDVFLAGLDDGVQAHRIWALDTLREIRDTGADRILKREHDNREPRIPVSRDGAVLGDVPRILGVRRRSANGSTQHERTLFDYMTFDELRQKLAEFTLQVRAYERDLHLIIRLLALQSEAPDAKTPADACTTLGTSVEQWLAAA